MGFLSKLFRKGKKEDFRAVQGSEPLLDYRGFLINELGLKGRDYSDLSRGVGLDSTTEELEESLRELYEMKDREAVKELYRYRKSHSI